MSQLIDLITQQLGAGTTQQVGRQLGLDESATESAIAAALPALIGGLAKNAQSPTGAESLAHALERDHDGSVLNNLGGLLGALQGGSQGSDLGGLLGAATSMLGGGASSKKTLDADGILGHILGGKRGQVEQGVGQASGIDAAQSGELLKMLAPIVMGALGQMKRQKGLDAGGLTDLLTQERSQIGNRSRRQSGGSLLDLLDADGDGNVIDDVGGLLGGLLGGKR